MGNVMGVVLAAGQGKRMKSKLYKVLHPVCGKPMVGYALEALEQLDSAQIIVVVGHGAEQVKSYVGDRARFVHQQEQLGTGHAVLQAQPAIGGEEGVTFVVCGDTPLVSGETLQGMLEHHLREQNAATIMTAHMENPLGLGRIIRGAGGAVERIVEQKDCSPEEAAVKEINAGTYCFDNRKLFAALGQITNANKQQEYYLTDVIGILTAAHENVSTYTTADASEAIGVNDRVALAEAERAMQSRINRRHMLEGVTLIDPANTYIGSEVRIGQDTIIYPGTVLKGATVIGSGCTLGPGTDVTDSNIGDRVEIQHSVLLHAAVDDQATVGPFAYLRPGAHIGKKVKIGDFVEIKNATLGEGSKVSHLSYIGDARVGKNVNIGCGTITVNYDGYNKHITEVEDNAFVGCNVNLVAPVTVGEGAYVVAGSTITQPVGPGDMAIARERQINKPGYAAKLRSKLSEQAPK